LTAFLRRVDRELENDCDVVLIGGGAVGLHYIGTHVTADLDFWSASDPDFWQAVARANRNEPRVPVQHAFIATPPYTFEQRLIRLKLPRTKRLRVFVPEAHDLVLMKVARGEAHDLDAIEDIHRHTPLDRDTLVARYRETRPIVIGSKRLHMLQFLSTVARLFGDAVAEDVATALES
jgi:hypothetical protein